MPVILHMRIDPLFLSYCFLFSILILLTREEAAIRELLTVSEDTRPRRSAEGAHLHIVHLSDASSSLDLIMVLYFFCFMRMRCILSSITYRLCLKFLLTGIESQFG